MHLAIKALTTRTYHNHHFIYDLNLRTAAAFGQRRTIVVRKKRRRRRPPVPKKQMRKNGMDMHWYQQLTSTTNTPSYFYCQQDGVQDQYHIFFCFQARQKLRRGVGSLSFPFPPFWTFSPPRASYHASILPFLPKNRRPSHLCSTANERGFFLKICDVEHGVYTKQFGLVFGQEENNVVSSHYFLRGLFQRTYKTMKHGYVTCVVGHECVQSDFGTKRITNDGNKMSYCIRYKHKQTI